MIAQFLLFLPCIVSLLWAGIYVFKRKNKTQKLLFCSLFLSAYYYFAIIQFYLSEGDYHLSVRLDVLNLPCALALLAVNLLFILAHQYPDITRHRATLLLFFPSAMYLAVNPLLYYLVTFDGAEQITRQVLASGASNVSYEAPLHQLYVYLCYQWFDILGLLTLAATMFACIHVSLRQGYHFGAVFRFFFVPGVCTTPARAICFFQLLLLLFIAVYTLLDFLGCMTLSYGAIIMFLVAICLHLMCYVEYFSEISVFSLKNLAHIDLFDTSKVEPSVSAESSAPSPAAASETPAPSPAPAQAASATLPRVEHTLATAVSKALDEDEVYRDADLSIVSLAERLGTNRTTLSMVINQTYGVPFRQVINNYRIEAAKSYMLNHPDATQEAVASACGFLTAQSFNIKFKEIVGQSPRVWLLNQ